MQQEEEEVFTARYDRAWPYLLLVSGLFLVALGLYEAVAAVALQDTRTGLQMLALVILGGVFAIPSARAVRRIRFGREMVVQRVAAPSIRIPDITDIGGGFVRTRRGTLFYGLMFNEYELLEQLDRLRESGIISAAQLEGRLTFEAALRWRAARYAIVPGITLTLVLLVVLPAHEPSSTPHWRERGIVARVIDPLAVPAVLGFLFSWVVTYVLVRRDRTVRELLAHFDRGRAERWMREWRDGSWLAGLHEIVARAARWAALPALALTLWGVISWGLALPEATLDRLPGCGRPAGAPRVSGRLTLRTPPAPRDPRACAPARARCPRRSARRDRRRRRGGRARSREGRSSRPG